VPLHGERHGLLGRRRTHVTDEGEHLVLFDHPVHVRDGAVRLVAVVAFDEDEFAAVDAAHLVLAAKRVSMPSLMPRPSSFVGPSNGR